ncbi:2Fe-2S iron-sulfur cluster-binding protein [Magnetovibrio sp.]|uniref:2Fe-2S iron-sulfur cluster-binding protein n=1 Tax=Magnetovibrio sp. TaxID=2024836 RepID=UPI002F926A3D
MSTEHNPVPKTYSVSLVTGERFECAENEKVLLAMERLHMAGVQIGCRGGGCGACRIAVLKGEYELLPMSKNHVSDEEAAQGFALACRVMPNSDLVIEAAPKTSN